MSTLFDAAQEAEKDAVFQAARDAVRGPAPRAYVAASLFLAGHPAHYHKEGEEYPALHDYQLYPGLVVEVVMPNPHSLVKPGHVEAVLTRVHSINNYGRAGSFTLGIGGSKQLADFAAPPRCFPQRRSWGVVGDRMGFHLPTTAGKVYGTLADVDNLSVHAGDHPKVRVVEHQPNRPAKVHKVFVSSLIHDHQWMDDMAQTRLQQQADGQYPHAWDHPESDSSPAPLMSLAAASKLTFSDFKELRPGEGYFETADGVWGIATPENHGTDTVATTGMFVIWEGEDSIDTADTMQGAIDKINQDYRAAESGDATSALEAQALAQAQRIRIMKLKAHLRPAS